MIPAVEHLLKHSEIKENVVCEEHFIDHTVFVCPLMNEAFAKIATGCYSFQGIKLGALLNNAKTTYQRK